MKFRKKPLVIHAEQWLGTKESIEKVMRMLQARPPANQVKTIEIPDTLSQESRYDIVIKTLESGPQDMQRPSIGDWIISGVNLEVYACKPDIFLKTYELEPV